jgi:NAD-dependent deacetylase
MEQIDDIKQRLFASSFPVVLTGAGVSAESGVPTFRGKDGLWKNFRAEDLATPQAFQRDPALVWEWYNWRREKVSGLKPNPAHYALVELGKRFRDFTIITQNVDGLHALAGTSDVLELHGNIWRVRCVSCGMVSGNRKVPIEIPPLCECGGLLRPDIVWFGESLPEEVVERAFKALERTDFILVIGTSGIVQPTASFAATAKGNGAFLVEINLERTPLSDIMDIVVLGKAGEVLPKLL